MSLTKEKNQTAGQIRKKLILSLAVNGLIPAVLYALLRPHLADDANALAIAGLVPLARTLLTWFTQRRVEWIGALAVLGFAIAVTVSTLLGGNALVLKVHGSLLAGAFGLVLIISAAIGKPLLLPILQAFSRSDLERSNTLEASSSSPHGRKRISLVTVLIGLVLLLDTTAHIILALILPTGTFLLTSKIVNWVILGSGVFMIWLSRKQIGARG